MSDLLNRINNQIIKEKQINAGQTASISANNVFQLARNNDRIIEQQVEKAFSAVERDNTFENIERQIGILKNYMPDAFLPQTKAVLEVGVNNLLNHKNFMQKRNEGIDAVTQQIRKLDDDDNKEGLFAIQDNIKKLVTTNMLNDESYKYVSGQLKTRLDELQQEDIRQIEFDFAQALPSIYKKEGISGVNVAIAKAMQDSEDPTIQGRLQTFVDNFTNRLDKSTKALAEENQLMAGQSMNKYITTVKGLDSDISTAIDTYIETVGPNTSMTPPKLAEMQNRYGNNFNERYGGGSERSEPNFQVQRELENKLDLIDALMSIPKLREAYKEYAMTPKHDDKTAADIIRDFDHPMHRATVMDQLQVIRDYYNDGTQVTKDAHVHGLSMVDKLIQSLDYTYDNSPQIYGFGGNWGKSDTIDTEDTVMNQTFLPTDSTTVRNQANSSFLR
tara:strand:+ start:1756 stop:3090 length:1335 start_codon:yes stop_codon:yes gene_type:complete